MEMKTLLDWQERGLNARILGLPVSDHPLLQTDRQPEVTGESLEEWQLKYDAWMFGWTIEDSVRQNETRINKALIRTTA